MNMYNSYLMEDSYPMEDGYNGKPGKGYTHPTDYSDYSTDINRNTKVLMREQEEGEILPLEDGLTHRQRIK